MIAPAAQTSKGLAKAFVSSAGGKGPVPLSLQTNLPAPISSRLQDAPGRPLTDGEPRSQEDTRGRYAASYLMSPVASPCPLCLPWASPSSRRKLFEICATIMQQVLLHL
jgi:hypothetical protein